MFEAPIIDFCDAKGKVGIGNIKMLNLEFYNGVDLYSSEENIESELLSIVTNNELNNYENVLNNDSRWPILYHLSPERHNLLEWYSFKKEAVLLEIGCGCGALTGLFCEKIDKVVAVELSKRRAEICNGRMSKSYSNFEIFVGDIGDMKFKNCFDYITLIDAFNYTNKKSLKMLHSLLKPGGTIIVAAENKFGFNRWSWVKKEHIERCAEAFSANEIKELLEVCGFKNVDFYYPHPDYKLPTEIYSDQYLPGICSSLSKTSNYDAERCVFLDEEMVMHNIIKNGKYTFFANSFLIFCTKDDGK